MTASFVATAEAVEDSLSRGDAAQAVRLSDALLRARPADARALRLHARALLAAGQAGRVVELLQREHADDPERDRLLVAALLRAGDTGRTADVARRALAQRPDDFLLRLTLAEALDAEGATDDALPHFFRAVTDAQRVGRWLDEASTAPAMRERVLHAMDRVDAGRADYFDRVMAPHVEAFGASAMARVIEGLRLYLGLDRAPADDPRRPKFLHLPTLPREPWFDRGLFAWYDALEASTPAIVDEMQRVLNDRDALRPFLEVDTRAEEDAYLGGSADSRAWDGYFFHRHGEAFAAHLDACPATAEALSRVPLTRIEHHAPEVLFSILAPDTHIKPHVGVTNTRVVTHVPLLIPDGDCRLVVGGVARGWRPGQCMTFDDTYLHEAWNRTPCVRVVMLLDTWNPYLTPEECVALKDLVERIGAFNQRAGIR